MNFILERLEVVIMWLKSLHLQPELRRVGLRDVSAVVGPRSAAVREFEPDGGFDEGRQGGAAQAEREAELLQAVQRGRGGLSGEESLRAFELLIIVTVKVLAETGG